MTLTVRIATPGDDPGEIQGRVREVVRELASTLRPEMPFRDAMSVRQGWDVEGVAGRAGVGARLSYIEGEDTFSVTVRALYADDAAGEQEWCVDPEVEGPITTPEARRRGQIVTAAGFSGALVGPILFYLAAAPFIGTTATILGVLFATPFGALAALVANQALPAAAAPPDPAAKFLAWREEVRAALGAHPDLRLV